MTDSATWLTRFRTDPKRWLPWIIRSGNSEHVFEALQDHPHLIHARFSGNITPLLEAGYSGHPEIADGLLARGAKMDFISAIALGRSEIVGAMLNENPSLVHKHSPDRWAAIHIAARYADAKTLSLLISAGADVNDVSNTKKLPPLFLAYREPYENAELLLNRGADINARAKHGFTVIHFAAMAGRLTFIEFLLAHGACATKQTEGRQTAWALAVRHGHRTVAALLSRSR